MKICFLFFKYFFLDEFVKFEKILNFSIFFYFFMNRGEINKGRGDFQFVLVGKYYWNFLVSYSWIEIIFEFRF